MLQLAIGGIGPQELFIILLVLLLLFGARKLPELARSMGSSITSFKKGLKDEQELLDKAGSSSAESPETRRESTAAESRPRGSTGEKEAS